MYFVICLQNLCKTFNEIKYVHHYTYWLRIRFSLIGICNMQSNSVNQSVVLNLRQLINNLFTTKIKLLTIQVSTNRVLVQYIYVMI